TSNLNQERRQERTSDVRYQQCRRLRQVFNRVRTELSLAQVREKDLRQ
ncbi:7500_t:CDS:1, partial [Funneliformis geosporum]